MNALYTIKTIWAWRKGEDGPELLDAWEEYAVENNHRGWAEAQAKQSAFVLDEANGFYVEQGTRVLDIQINFDKVQEAFYAAEIEGEVA